MRVVAATDIYDKSEQHSGQKVLAWLVEIDCDIVGNCRALAGYEGVIARVVRDHSSS